MLFKFLAKVFPATAEPIFQKLQQRLVQGGQNKSKYLITVRDIQTQEDATGIGNRTRRLFYPCQGYDGYAGYASQIVKIRQTLK